MNVWNELEEFKQELKSPKEVIEEMYNGVVSYTKELIDFKLEKVNYFPEEVKYTKSSFNVTLGASLIDELTPKAEPHPDYGYNPESSKNNELLRYRLLIFPDNYSNFEYELLKFKFPLNFYPVIFYIDKTDFTDLADFFHDEKLMALDYLRCVKLHDPGPWIQGIL